MSQLDEALIELRQKMDDPKCQFKQYGLFINSTFNVPPWRRGSGWR